MKPLLVTLTVYCICNANVCSAPVPSPVTRTQNQKAYQGVFMTKVNWWEQVQRQLSKLIRHGCCRFVEWMETQWEGVSLLVSCFIAPYLIVLVPLFKIFNTALTINRLRSCCFYRTNTTVAQWTGGSLVHIRAWYQVGVPVVQEHSKLVSLI